MKKTLCIIAAAAALLSLATAASANITSSETSGQPPTASGPQTTDPTICDGCAGASCCGYRSGIAGS